MAKLPAEGIQIDGNWSYPFKVNIEAIVADGEYNLRGNAVLIKNAGSFKVFLNNDFTLQPGESVEIGSMSDLTMLDQEFLIRFDSVAASTSGGQSGPRVEIMEYVLLHPKLSNYVKP